MTRSLNRLTLTTGMATALSVGLLVGNVGHALQLDDVQPPALQQDEPRDVPGQVPGDQPGQDDTPGLPNDQPQIPDQPQQPDDQPRQPDDQPRQPDEPRLPDQPDDPLRPDDEPQRPDDEPQRPDQPEEEEEEVELGAELTEADGQLTIDQIGEASLAAQAGLRRGDQILSADGQRFRSVRGFEQFLQQRWGRPVPIVVLRDGVEQRIMLNLVTDRMRSRAVLGVTLADDPRGVVIAQVVPGGPAEQAGIRPGDHLVSVNGMRYRDTASVIAGLARLQPGQRVELGIGRAGQVIVAEAQLGERGEVFAEFDPRAPRQDRFALRPDAESHEQIEQLRRQIRQLERDVQTLRQELQHLRQPEQP